MMSKPIAEQFFAQMLLTSGAWENVTETPRWHLSEAHEDAVHVRTALQHRARVIIAATGEIVE